MLCRTQGIRDDKRHDHKENNGQTKTEGYAASNKTAQKGHRNEMKRMEPAQCTLYSFMNTSVDSWFMRGTSRQNFYNVHEMQNV